MTLTIAYRYQGSKLQGMGDEIVIGTGDDYLIELKKSIDSAKNSIHLETYIFDQDETGLELLNLLGEAAARGVRTQLLIDGVGSSAWTFADAVLWREKGIELKFFHALPWQKHFSTVWKLFSLKKIVTGFAKLNRRNHRKICIIDDTTIFISSMNVSDRHLASRVGSAAWRDISVKLTGEVTHNYLAAAKEAWNFSQNHHGRRWSKISKTKKMEYNDLLKKINSAKNEIWITNPYFVPDLRLTRALCKAAWSGVRVRLLLPNRSDIFGLKFAMESYYNALLTYGAEIYEFKTAILHAKILIIDDWVSLGSFNLDFRSIFYNLETSAILTRAENVVQVQAQFLNDIQISEKIDLTVWKNRSWVHRTLEKFFLLFRGWL